MEVTALCIRLLMNVLMLLVAQVHLNDAQESDASFTRIVPSRLQLFEYNSIAFSCEGFNESTGWTVMRKVNGKVSACVTTWMTTTASVCAIGPVYQTNSGEYWCGTGKERSNAVNITVTAGPVILESAALPVLEGEDVTLSCRRKIIADFYKDGLFVGTSSTGAMVIRGISKSNEGLYKCSFSDFGESPQSWLAVRVLHRETRPPSDLLLLRTIFTIFLVALLLLLVGLLHCGKLRVTQKYFCICKMPNWTKERVDDNE